MTEEGPPLESLTHRLAECPPEFLLEPVVESHGKVHAAAVVGDLLKELGASGGLDLELFQGSLDVRGERRSRAGLVRDPVRHANWLRLVLVSSWLLHDSWFRERKSFDTLAHTFLAEGLDELATVAEAGQFVSEPDRREELVRRCLNALNLRPAGETIAQARDRLTTVDSVELQRVLADTAAAEARARQIREMMARKAAEAAAAKVTRE
jgi:hypothetical protein